MTLPLYILCQLWQVIFSHLKLGNYSSNSKWFLWRDWHVEKWYISFIKSMNILSKEAPLFS